MIIIICFSSCDYFSFERNKSVQQLDTIVDKSTVDVFPSFAVCDGIIEKEKKRSCFEETLFKEISKRLSTQKILVKTPIEETIEVIIVVRANNQFELKSIKASSELMIQIPDLKERISTCISDLPKIRAASKRGIPVTSEYTLPILIKLND